MRRLVTWLGGLAHLASWHAPLSRGGEWIEARCYALALWCWRHGEEWR